MLRRLQLAILGLVVLVGALSTGLPFLYYLVYLAILVVGGSYLVTRLGLVDLEAGYAVDRLSGHVGDRIRVTYTLRNTSRLPKLWLEVFNPTSLPTGLPGRALGLGARTERTWLVRSPLTRRGHFRIDPLQLRTGDPFGLFEASAAVGSGVPVIAFPRIEPIPLWRLPAAAIEGSHAHAERTLQATPLATTVRPWAPGDAFNRIHWKSTARHGEIQVKEFDLEQTADAWIVVDLDRSVQAGSGDESTVEAGIRAAAAIADRALAENRAVGMTVNGHRLVHLPADRGARQHLKVMQLLAAVDGDGVVPLSEALVATVGRIRRGMTVVVITASTDQAWVRPLGTIRSRGINCVVVAPDGGAFLRHAEDEELRRRGLPPRPAEAPSTAAGSDPTRALRHTLAEHDIPVCAVTPARPLAELLVS